MILLTYKTLLFHTDLSRRNCLDVEERLSTIITAKDMIFSIVGSKRQAMKP